MTTLAQEKNREGIARLPASRITALTRGPPSYMPPSSSPPSTARKPKHRLRGTRRTPSEDITVIPPLCFYTPPNNKLDFFWDWLPAATPQQGWKGTEVPQKKIESGELHTFLLQIAGKEEVVGVPPKSLSPSSSALYFSSPTLFVCVCVLGRERCAQRV